MLRSMIIAIDGPAGAGKSSLARSVAASLGFAYLDTGALYRTAVLAGRSCGVEPEEIAQELDIQLGDRVFLNGEDVTEAIRTPEISRLTPIAAARPSLRRALSAKQRSLLAHGNWVAEGRDIGTVVAPDADIKVFLTASAEERAKRRAQESGHDFDEVLKSIRERDRADTEREHSPLHAAEDAIEIDTTGMTLPEAVSQVLDLVPPEYRRTPALFAIHPEGVAAPRPRLQRRQAKR